MATKAERRWNRKSEADQGDDDELLDQPVAQVVHRALDQRRAVIGLDELDPGRQARP